MYRNFPGAYPAWFREGFAEFFMTATVTADGRATVGRSSPMRIQTLNSVRWLPMGEVLSSGFDETRRTQRAAFYAQSWLLMHWVLTDPERRRRMDGYLADTARGAGGTAALPGADAGTRLKLHSKSHRTSVTASRLLVIARGTPIGPEAGRPERQPPCSNSAGI